MKIEKFDKDMLTLKSNGVKFCMGILDKDTNQIVLTIKNDVLADYNYDQNKLVKKVAKDMQISTRLICFWYSRADKDLFVEGLANNKKEYKRVTDIIKTYVEVEV